ncbi:rho GTPase-activating protein 21-like, partial [Huso huso]
QAKGRRDGAPSSNERARLASGERLQWPGPSSLVLHKNSQGFGFTLRHVIVFPPESVVHCSPTDEENANGKGHQKGRLKAVDTIFVKNVREAGPAHMAGLCTGTRGEGTGTEGGSVALVDTAGVRGFCACECSLSV